MEHLYEEEFRPRFHFSPRHNWMNDPHALLWHAGEYHLFYQYHAESTIWGPMSWGHAVSVDRLHWQHLPIALCPDTIGTIFTGDVVHDRDNTSNLLPGGGLVAVHSYDDQSVGVATSADKGRTWQTFPGNPIIASPGGNFRDPKIFWDGKDRCWRMAIAREQSVQFYTSSNLLDWSYCGDFRAPTAGDLPWEVPDLFPLTAMGDPRWALLVSTPNALAGGAGMRYFIGEFTEGVFRSEIPEDEALWLDYGPDNYAGSTWKQDPSGRCVYLSWFNNWRYAAVLPTEGWRGALTIPRELQLLETTKGPRLRQFPIAEITTLRGEAKHWRGLLLQEGFDPLEGLRSASCEIQLVLEPREANEVCLRVLLGDTGGTRICYNVQEECLVVDRMNSGHTDFHEEFPAKQSIPLILQGEPLSLTVLVDQSMVEVFAQGGRVVSSARVFPKTGWDRLSLLAKGGAARLRALTVWPMASVWR